MAVLRAGGLYFAAIFALGFVLGTVRSLWLAERVGHFLGVLIELPVMLAASFWAARWLIRREVLAGRGFGTGQALAMGLLAFALLMAAEAALAAVLFGQSMNAWLAGLAMPAGLLGLAGQIGFALMPLAARRG